MSEQLRQEFNEWVRDGRAAGLEAHHRAFMEELIRQMAPGPRDRILELGCGDGWALRMLAPLAHEGTLVGIDVSDEMIGAARARSAAFENLLFVWSSAEEIPWQEDFFTNLFSVEAFYYFENPERVLREMYRVLAPGGSLWIVNHLSKENELSLRWVPKLKVPVQLHSAEEYGELFARCGFTNFSHRMIADTTPERTTLPPGNADESLRFRELGALLLTANKPAS